jgi:hypothetical protein
MLGGAAAAIDGVLWAMPSVGAIIQPERIKIHPADVAAADAASAASTAAAFPHSYFTCHAVVAKQHAPTSTVCIFIAEKCRDTMQHFPITVRTIQPLPCFPRV